MTSTAAPEDVKDDLLLQIRRLLDKSKSELQKEWKTMDCSGFEPIAKADLLAALLRRLLRGTSGSDIAQSQLSNTIPPAASPSFQSFLGKCGMLDGSISEDFAWGQERLGTYCPNKKGPQGRFLQACSPPQRCWTQI